MADIRVLELYSGIGGIHYALNDIPVKTNVVAAMDINTISNAVYKFNFPSCNIMQRNILSLTPDIFKKLEVNMLTMSPPCQPFTRQGNQRDCSDPRTESFIHILDILDRLMEKPRYLFLENVKGFESSEARDRLICTLNSCNYHYQEFLISPMNFGIPNSRLRYYLIAKQRNERFCFETIDKVLEDLDLLKCCSMCQRNISLKNQNLIDPISKYLEKHNEEDLESLLVPDNILLKYGNILDIVNQESKKSCCFTKGYGRYAEGTGSIFYSGCKSELDTVYNTLNSSISMKEEEKLKHLKSLKLRYFSPQEIANLMCFPNSFGFDGEITWKQKYKVLGNSVNVKVISILLSLLICK